MSLQPTSRSLNWPRLTESCRCEKQRDACQRCGVEGESGKNIQGWIEHDHNDNPEYRLVFLCLVCSEKLIEPHVRPYKRLEHNCPWPGAMEICSNCKWRKEITCTNPFAQVNGGPGLKYDIEAPSVAFYDGRDKHGKRTGWRERHWLNPAKGCSGKETA